MRHLVFLRPLSVRTLVATGPTKVILIEWPPVELVTPQAFAITPSASLRANYQRCENLEAGRAKDLGQY